MRECGSAKRHNIMSYQVSMLSRMVYVILQIAAFVLSRRLARRGAEPLPLAEKAPCDDDSDDSVAASSPEHVPHTWRKNANLRMYTILDKIF